MRPAFFLELRTLTCGGSQRHPWPPRRFCATCMIHRFMVSEWCWRKWRRLWNGLSLDLTSHSYTSLIHVHSACCTVWHWHHNILRTSTIVLGQVWWPLPPETQTAATRQEVVHTSFSALEQHAITVLTYDLQVDIKNMRFSPCLRARCHGLFCQSACSWKDYERLFCIDFPVLQSDDSCNTGFWWLGHGICDKNTCKSIILQERWSSHMQSWTWQRNRINTTTQTTFL